MIIYEKYIIIDRYIFSVTLEEEFTIWFQKWCKENKEYTKKNVKFYTKSNLLSVEFWQNLRLTERETI